MWCQIVPLSVITGGGGEFGVLNRLEHCCEESMHRTHSLNYSNRVIAESNELSFKLSFMS